ncbi:MAG: type II toxin-antitoxin system CcdA family antitoxin [Candidatus Bathyarchaeia archaeon]
MGSVISVRIPTDLKDDLKRYGVEVSEVTRKALEEEVRRREREELQRMAEELGDYLEKIPRERIVEGIREDRGPLG